MDLINPQKGGRPENEATSAAGLGNTSDIGLSTCGGPLPLGSTLPGEAPIEQMGNPVAVFGRDKAAKNDDAVIDVGYWDAHVVAPWSKYLDFDVKVQSFRETYDQ